MKIIYNSKTYKTNGPHLKKLLLTFSKLMCLGLDSVYKTVICQGLKKTKQNKNELHGETDEIFSWFFYLFKTIPWTQNCVP